MVFSLCSTNSTNFYFLNDFEDNLLPVVCIIRMAFSVIDIRYMGTAICCSSGHWSGCQ